MKRLYLLMASVGVMVAGVQPLQADHDRSSCGQPRKVVVQPYCPPTRYVVSSPQMMGGGSCNYRTQRVWVDGSWSYQDLGCGRYRKVWTPGYYTFVKVPVRSPSYGSYVRVSYR